MIKRKPKRYSVRHWKGKNYWLYPYKVKSWADGKANVKCFSFSFYLTHSWIKSCYKSL
jgi:hypothetical protein